jgi:hypothetical protein
VPDIRWPTFRSLYDKLPPEDRRRFRLAYRQYRRNPSLVRFEQKGRLPNGVPVYAARIDGNWRALAMIVGSDVLWYWIGKYTDYDRLLKGLRK